MHSSRMRTGRSLTVCCSLLPGGSAWSGGFSLVPGVLLGPGGGSPWSRGGSPWSREGFSLVPGGVLPGPGGISPCWGGVCLVPGGCLPGPGGFSRDPPLVNRITDTCKNITLATTVIGKTQLSCLARTGH